MKNTLTIKQRVYMEFWKLGLIEKAEEYGTEAGLTLEDKQEVLVAMNEEKES